jgi:hypothetical protein
VTHQQQVAVPQQRVDLNHIRHVETTPWVNEINIVARSFRRWQLRQVLGYDLADLMHLKRHHYNQIQDRRSARERYQPTLRIRPVGHGAAGQYGNNTPGRVKITISPAVALIKPHEEISDKSQNSRLRQ